MALTYTTDIAQFEGNKRVVRGLVTFDSSYPTGGEEFSLASIGMHRLDDLKLESDDGVLLEWNRSLTAPKIKAYRNVGTFTDSTGGTAGTSLAATVGVYVLPIPIGNLVTLSTGGVDVQTGIVLGHKFKILSWEFVTGTTVGTGSGASLVFNLEIGAVDVGTVASTCTVTLAGTSDIGERTAATAVSGANTGSATDAISLEVAGGGTAFTAGDGCFYVKVQNMDTADAFATLLTAGDEVASSVSLSGVTARFEAIGG